MSLTAVTLMVEFFLRAKAPSLLKEEMYISSKPSFSASDILLSTWLTGRISPLSPTSAAKHIFG